MTQQEVGWLCVLLGATYTIGIWAFPSHFNNWLLCPRWGMFGPPASRLTGIGAGLFMFSLGLVHLNTAHPVAPSWLPWGFAVVTVFVMISGFAHQPLYRRTA